MSDRKSHKGGKKEKIWWKGMNLVKLKSTSNDAFVPILTLLFALGFFLTAQQFIKASF